MNALEVRSHGPLRVGRFLIASIHPRRARLPAATVSGVGDRYSERSLGVDHLSSRRGGGARCSTPFGREQLAESLRCVTEVAYRCSRFSTSRRKERAKSMFRIAIHGVNRLLQCVERSSGALGRRVELREPGLCRRTLHLAVVPLATDLHESFVRLKILRQAFRNVSAGLRALRETTRHAPKTECFFFFAQYALDRRIVLPAAPDLSGFRMNPVDHQVHVRVLTVRVRDNEDLVLLQP